MITVAGGVYREILREPFWFDEVYGSGGRAACTLSNFSDEIIFHTYLSNELQEYAESLEADFKFDLIKTAGTQSISFDYFHCLSSPTIYPSRSQIRHQPPIQISGDIILRFGFMEGDAVINCKKAVYDPQCEIDTPNFFKNSSKAEAVALVANAREIKELSKNSDEINGANRLVEEPLVEVVVLKRGPLGVYVTSKTEHAFIPAFKTSRVSSIGSGDVFSSVFAHHWGEKNTNPIEAATFASAATAFFCNTRCLLIPKFADLDHSKYPPLPVKANLKGKQVYLAGPFFTISQRWMIAETKRCLEGFGVKVFSPMHVVGFGEPEHVAPKDLKGLRKSNCVFAIVSGTDPGTLFEIGYANSRNIPTVALAQSVSKSDLTMLKGTNCIIKNDFASAMYETIWQLLEL